MFRYVLVSLVFLLFVFVFQDASAYTVYYHALDFKLTKIPMFCIYESNDPKIPHWAAKDWAKEAKNSAGEWKAHLTGGFNRANWDIQSKIVTLEEQSLFDRSICDIEIFFVDKPPKDQSWAGVFVPQGQNKGAILIGYIDWELCETGRDRFYIYYEMCFLDKYRSTAKIGNIARHEIGHALGLGHYTSDDAGLNRQWVRGDMEAPSIMVETLHVIDDFQFIKPVDLEKLKEIYGMQGFIPQHLDPNYSPSFEYFTVSKSSYFIAPNSKELIEISGKVTEEEYANRQNVIITITRPDGSTEEKKVFVTIGRMFSLQMRMEPDMMQGTYKVVGKYMGKKSNEVIFSVWEGRDIAPTQKQIPLPQTQKQYQIPDWIRNNAKWWSENQISDSDFVQGIQYLIDQRVLQVSYIGTSSSLADDKIPSWVKTNAGWWANRMISDKDFVQGIQHLMKIGIIRI